MTQAIHRGTVHLPDRGSRATARVVAENSFVVSDLNYTEADRFE
jgi:hypothetical protein